MDFSKEQVKTLKAVVGQAIGTNNEFLRQEMKDESRNNRDLLLQEIRASEQRIKTELSQDIKAAKQETIEAVNDMIDGGLNPQIDKLDQRLTKLEARSA